MRVEQMDLRERGHQAEREEEQRHRAEASEHRDCADDREREDERTDEPNLDPNEEICDPIQQMEYLAGGAIGNWRADSLAHGEEAHDAREAQQTSHSEYDDEIRDEMAATLGFAASEQKQHTGQSERTPRQHGEHVSPEERAEDDAEQHCAPPQSLARTKQRQREVERDEDSEREHRIHARVRAFPCGVQVEGEHRRDAECERG